MLAFEPEAAALYCRLLPIDTMKISGGNNYLSCFEAGKKIIIVDLGGNIKYNVHDISFWMEILSKLVLA
jgi:hypothetical protein